MKADNQEQIDALQRLTDSRLGKKVQKVGKQKYPKPASKNYEAKPEIEKAASSPWVRRKCLRCSREFETKDRFHRLCSELCREGAYFTNGGSTGRWVEGRRN